LLTTVACPIQIGPFFQLYCAQLSVLF
jgi:hypothetical protein